MKLKVLVPIICSIFCFKQSLAQRQNSHFYNKRGEIVDTRDSASFIRMITDPDSGSHLYRVFEYYLNGKTKLTGYSSNFNFMALEGQCFKFFPNGKRQQIANYKQGFQVDNEYNYFPNGKIYSHRQYFSDNKNTEKGVNNFLIKACFDSTGHALVTDGNGYYIGYDDDFKSVFEEGNINSGLKEGNWKGVVKVGEDNFIINEIYKNGKMISGQSVGKDGQIVNYAKRNVVPEFKGGVMAFVSYLSKKLSYPADAKENNITGRVYMGFIVEKDGSLINIRAFNRPSEDLVAEGIRILKESPKWTPGLQYGRPIRVQYTIPINFSLGEE